MCGKTFKPKYIIPDDVVKKIISKMDIDTRRSLNIYTKLKIPQDLQDKISACFLPIDEYIVTNEIMDVGQYNYTAYVVLLKHKTVKSKYHKYCKYYEIIHEVFEKDVVYRIIPRIYTEYVNDKDPHNTYTSRLLDRMYYYNDPDYVQPYYDEQFEEMYKELKKILHEVTYYGLTNRSVQKNAFGSTDNMELIRTVYYADIDNVPTFTYHSIFGEI